MNEARFNKSLIKLKRNTAFWHTTSSFLIEVILPHTSKNLRRSIVYSKTQFLIKLASSCVWWMINFKGLYIWWDGHHDSSMNITRYVEKSTKRTSILYHLNYDYLYYLQLWCSFIVLQWIFKEILWPELQNREYWISLQNGEVLSCFSFLTFSITLR